MRLALLAASLVLSACAFTAEQSPQAIRALPAGQYSLEKDHASLFFRVKHLGLSWYTIRLTAFDAALDFDPARPAAARVAASVDTTSVQTDHPTDKDWDTRISRDLLKSQTFPQATFTTTKVDLTGPYTARVTGDLALMGVTQPVTLDVTYNGSMAAAALYGGRPAVGFSARGTFRRSDFGSTRYSEFVGDEIELVIEAEFTQLN